MPKQKQPKQPEDIEEFLRRAFDENFERLRYESGHSLSPEVREAAWQQSLFYWRLLREVAEHVTDTEVKLTLPGCETPKGRKFSIEGVVDIVRDEDCTVMYDLKTHDPDYIHAHLGQYEQQLNVYAYIWKILRGQDLDKAAVISTQFPEALREAWTNQKEDPARLAQELQEKSPVIPIKYDTSRICDTVDDFEKVVDAIEDGKFAPASVSQLKKIESKKQAFATRVCRNCDVRFSCRTYYDYVRTTARSGARELRRFYDDFGPPEEVEERLNTALPEIPPAAQLIENV